MTDLEQRLAALSPTQRLALADRLRARKPAQAEVEPTRPLDFSVFYFAGSAATTTTDGEDPQRYRFLLETAKLADQLGFSAVWTPERHFHDFGGLYPNPSVLGAALAVVTERVRIRAGSLVLPLHHPVRACEDWSVVDNLSNGRVGISFATGWHPSDFVFAPESYERRRQLTWEMIPLVQKLWRGEQVTFPGPGGHDITPTLFPRPVQPELPIWVTASGNKDTFDTAARLGANVLSALIGQSPEQLADNIAHYRAVRAEHGLDPGAGKITVMLHAYLTEDAEEARDAARAPLREYLRGYLQQQADMPSGADSQANIETQLDFAYERYSTQAALIGSPSSVKPLLAKLAAAGADEIALLVDFGIPLDDAARGIERLAMLRAPEQARPNVSTAGNGIRRDEPMHAPLSIDQERMYRLERANPAGAANIVGTALGIRGPVRVDVLQSALDLVGARHETLRTTFREIGGSPVQVIGTEFAVRIIQHDLTDLPPGQRMRAAREVRTALANEPFPFDQPLVRVALIKLAEEEYQLAVVKQHLITDWVSFNVFLRELFHGYGELLLGRTPRFPEPVPYRAFAERELSRMRDGKLDDQLDYWVKQLADPPEPVTLPIRGQRPAVRTFPGRREWMLFPDEIGARLTELSRAERVTPFMTVLTALNACLMRVADQPDVMIGSPTANRDWAPEQLAGFLLKPMVLRAPLREEQTFRSALGEVRAVTAKALANAEVPFASLVQRLCPERELDWLPLFRWRYLFLRWEEPVTVAGLRLSPVDVDPRASLYDGTVSLWESARGLFGRFEYNTDLFEPDTVVGTMERFATMLSSALRDPDQRLGDLPDSSATRYHVDEDELEQRLAGEAR